MRLEERSRRNSMQEMPCVRPEAEEQIGRPQEVASARQAIDRLMSTDLPFILLAGLILGVVQGVSEWLPISSKTQVIIVSTFLLGLTFTQGYTLGLFLELGTFFAAVIYFRRELLSVFKSIANRSDRVGRLLLKYLLVVTVITGVMGVAIYKAVESLSLGSAIGGPMLVLGAVLILDGLFIRFSRSRMSPRKKLEDMKLKELVTIGFAQGLAAFPGVSRSGVTVSTMLVLGPTSGNHSDSHSSP